MKKILYIVAITILLGVTHNAYALKSMGYEILDANEKAGISYVVPTGYSNMGTYERNQAYTVLYGEDDFADSQTHEIRVYTLNTNAFTALLKTAKTSAEASSTFSKYYPIKSNEQLLAVEIRTIGVEKFIVMDLLKTGAAKTLHYRIAYVEKNNKIYVVEFVDNQESFLKNVVNYENFLKSFSVKDLSKKSIPFVGKSVNLQGAASTLNFNLPEGYFVQDTVENTIYISNIQNKAISISTYDQSLSVNKDIANVKTNAELVKLMKSKSQFTKMSTVEGQGNSYFVNAYIKTVNGQKMFIVDYTVNFYGMVGSDEVIKDVYVFKNGTVYTISFMDLNTHSDKVVDELLKTVKFRDSKRIFVK